MEDVTCSKRVTLEKCERCQIGRYLEPKVKTAEKYKLQENMIRVFGSDVAVK